MLRIYKYKKGVGLYEVKRFIHRSGVCRGFGANVKEREKVWGLESTISKDVL